MTATTDRISELVVVLDRMAALYREMTFLAREKVAHMSKADRAALGADADREKLLVQRAVEQDGLRRQLLELIGRGWGMNATVARRMTSTQLLARLEPARRAEVERAVRDLRNAAAELSESHRMAGLVATQVLAHLREVFAAVSHLDESAAVYTPAGRIPQAGARRIFEATG